MREFISIASNFDCIISDIALDSRKVHPGSVFVAYAGANYDGRDFIAEAVANGAVAIIQEGDLSSVTQKAFDAEKKITIISLDDIRSKIGIIAAKFYGNPTKEMSVVGVTGTNGKTSCTQFIAKSLQALGQSCGVIGTLGMGLPDELISTVNTTPDAITLQWQFAKFKKQNIKTVAMEVSSHGLEQKRVEGINFKIAVFTNLTHEHLDSHHDMENYFAAKKKLFLWPNLQYAVINVDDPYGRRLLQEVPSSVNSYAYSVSGQDLSLNIPTVKSSDVSLDRNGFSAKIISPWGEGVIQSSLLGVFNLSNLLAVFTTLMLLGVEFEEAFKSLSLLKPFAGRMQSYGGGKFPLIVVDYAHTPDALENALAALREHCHGKLWCVFGCGGDRDRGKRPIMGQIAERLSDNIIITDDNPRNEDPEQIVKDIVAGLLCPWAAEIEHDRRTAITHAINNAGPQDVILIAGKGHENYQIIGNEKIPFNDADVVLSCLGSF
jgi:UDP-N-acetylmuramoyl-L-alanyl-D-glutamate--2,6-diaminopimelate ligase